MSTEEVFEYWAIVENKFTATLVEVYSNFNSGLDISLKV